MHVGRIVTAVIVSVALLAGCTKNPPSPPEPIAPVATDRQAAPSLDKPSLTAESFTVVAAGDPVEQWRHDNQAASAENGGVRAGQPGGRRPTGRR